MEETKKKLRNYAFVEGYLRECYLKEGVSTSGKAYISGDVVVSITRFNAQRVHVFAFATKTDGSKNKAYESLKALLGDKTVTIASYVKNLPQEGIEMDTLDEHIWEAASKIATKVWFSGSLEEYATISVGEDNKERETSTFSFRAANGAIRRDNDKRAFSPRSNVELDGSILSIRNEVKKGEGEDAEPEETGRLVIDYLYIDYKGIGHKFKLFAGSEPINPANKNSDTFADYISEHYEVGQTAKFNIAIVNLAEQKTVAPKAMSWGQTSAPTVVTRFVHELRIIGGRSMEGIGDDSDEYIAKEEVTDASTKRRVNAKENWEQSQARKNKAPAPKSESFKGFGQESATGPQIGADNFTVPDFTDF